ncbi:flavodoxin [uncultured Pseudoramibacter sp.]|uniref:flavodoxin n=1 Tax=uncultured Pseudoramibacter sp. TaxID=1623493 RepID=UPI0025E4811F|nr:flavodoxin [uncultured Pseudoramibacter sp.]
MNKGITVFFSASGITKKVAEKVAKVTGTGLYEIVPEVPYSKADLNWNDKRSRSSRETDDPAARPAIQDSPVDLSAYDVIYLGFPIWWYREPKIIDTFLESEDLEGKTLIPFVTSGSSPIGDTVTYLKQIAPKADIREGKRFTGSVTEDELHRWVVSESV